MSIDFLLSYLHFISIILTAICLAAELALFRPEMSLSTARLLSRVDAAYGPVAMSILITGLLRVFYGLKGSAFYLSNTFFWVLIAVFVLVGLLSIPLTRVILKWRPALGENTTPEVSPEVFKRVRRFLFAQLALFLLLPLVAGLMARGY